MNLKYSMIAIIVLGSVILKAQKGTFESPKEKVSYAIGLNFEQNLQNLENTMPPGESPNVNDYIDGIKSVVSSTKGKSASYLQGVMVGSQIQNYLINIGAEDKIDYNTVYAAITAKFYNEAIEMSEDSAAMIIQNFFEPMDEEFQNKQNENREKRLNIKKEENAKASKEFLVKNASKQGVKTTADGLQYKVIKQGSGPTPAAEDNVDVIYTGKTIDGKEFDSSNGKTVKMNLAQVIPGFREGVMMMNKGSKYQLFIPYNLAYGEQGPPKIGPNQVLIFEVELVDFAPLTEMEKQQMEKMNKERPLPPRPVRIKN